MSDRRLKTLRMVATIIYILLFLGWLVAAVVMLLGGVTPNVAGILWILFSLYPIAVIGSLVGSYVWQRQQRYKAALSVLLVPFLLLLATLAAFLARVGELPLPGDQISNCYYIVDREVRVQYYSRAFESAVRNREIHVVAEGHPRSFEPLPYELDACGEGAEFYARDRANVYRRTEIVPNADPATFEILSDGYTRDANYVFHFHFEEGLLLTEADPTTFVVLGHGYARDGQHAYYGGERISNADGPTFELLPDARGYARDQNYVYEAGIVIERIADPTTWQPLGWYSLDSQHVYHHELVGHTNPFRIAVDPFRDELIVVAEADPDTFQTVDEVDDVNRSGGGFPYGRDSEHVFYGETAVSAANPDGLKSFNFSYWTDGTYVYFQTERVEGASPATFSADGLSGTDTATGTTYENGVAVSGP